MENIPLIKLEEIAGGALQENAQKAIAEIVTNMQDPNTPWKTKRSVTIKLAFIQNDDRSDSTCEISVEKKLAPVKPLETKFSIGKDILNGGVYMEEYGPQIRGQMSLEDYQKEQIIENNIVDTDTGEIIGKANVTDFKAKEA